MIDCVDSSVDITLTNDGGTHSEVYSSKITNNTIVTLEDTVVSDQYYTVSVSLTIINGTYSITNTTSFSESIIFILRNDAIFSLIDTFGYSITLPPITTEHCTITSTIITTTLMTTPLAGIIV